MDISKPAVYSKRTLWHSDFFRMARTYEQIINLRRGQTKEQEEAISNLETIYRELGPQRTAEELLPYLTETPCFSERNWLDIVEQLSKIDITLFHEGLLSVFFTELCSLLKIQSKLVRDSLFRTIGGFVSKVDSGIISNIFRPIIEKYAQNSLYKAPSLLLLANISEYLSSEVLEELYIKFSEMYNDNSALVKHSYVVACCSIAPNVSTNIHNMMLQCIDSLTSNGSLPILAECINFIQIYNKVTGNAINSFPAVERIAKHKNWNVRYRLLDRLDQIIQDLPVDTDKVYDLLTSVIECDTDDEVKGRAAKQIGYYATLPNASDKKCVALYEAVSKGKYNNIEHPIAQINGIKSLEKVAGISTDNYVQDKVNQLLTSGNKDILIAALPVIASISVDEDALIKCLNEIFLKADLWRDREPICYILKNILHNSSVESANIVCKFLLDDACAIRSACLNEIKSICESLGPEWTTTHFANALLDNFKSEDYQHRQAIVVAVIKAELAETDIGSQILVSASQDPVSNVRYVVAKSLPRDHALVYKLRADLDEDVRDIANSL